MNEHIIAALVRRDEAKTFLIIVKLHGTTGHIIAFRNMNAHKHTVPRRLPLLVKPSFGREVERAPSIAQVKRPQLSGQSRKLTLRLLGANDKS